ncbi:MAG TPA: hypothetical protein VLA79_11670 [Polyangia bacterium]|nr:hypothetical protein [Polyangia bacterium]
MRADAQVPRQLPLMLVLALAVAGAAACGGSAAPSHPDTGYGANQPVPATMNCTDFCTRAADCGGQLCNEDTMTTQYTALVPILISECESVACNANVLSQISAAAWQCYFQSSCRQVLGENVCHVANASYTCN